MTTTPTTMLFKLRHRGVVVGGRSLLLRRIGSSIKKEQPVISNRLTSSPSLSSSSTLPSLLLSSSSYDRCTSFTFPRNTYGLIAMGIVIGNNNNNDDSNHQTTQTSPVDDTVALSFVSSSPRFIPKELRGYCTESNYWGVAGPTRDRTTKSTLEHEEAESAAATAASSSSDEEDDDEDHGMTTSAPSSSSSYASQRRRRRSMSRSRPTLTSSSSRRRTSSSRPRCPNKKQKQHTTHRRKTNKKATWVQTDHTTTTRVPGFTSSSSSLSPAMTSTVSTSTPSNDDDDNDKDDSDGDSDDSTIGRNNNEDGLSVYEQLRLARIQQNQERLQELGLDKFNIQPPTNKKQKRAHKNTVTTVHPRRSQPPRSAKKKVPNKELLEQIRENDNTVVPPFRRSNRIQENQHKRERSTTPHHGNTAVEIDIPTDIMSDIVTGRLIDLDEDSYVDEEDIEEDDDDDDEDVQSMVKFKPDTAMNIEDDVLPRLLELGLVTPAQVRLRGFSVRLAVENDWRARTKKELQQQVLHQCEHCMLARWVLQDDGTRILEIVRCSGIEGHHKDTPSSWAHPKSVMRHHRLNVNGPYKKDTFYEEKRWILKTCTRNRAGPLDDAPMVYGVRQNVECLMGTSNATQSAFGTPINDAMNGEIKLTTGVLGLYTQDGVDMVMNSPIINDGSNGKLVQLFISIKEPSESKPMLHTMSNTTDPSKFMAAHNTTLNGVRTSKQSTALQNKIYRMQMAIYEKSLALRTAKKHSADSSKGGKKGGKKGGRICAEKKSGVRRLITTDVMHGIARGDTVVHGIHGKGKVRSVTRPRRSKGTCRVTFYDQERSEGKDRERVAISSLVHEGKQCYFVKEYKNALTDEMKFQFCVEFRCQQLTKKNPLGMAEFLEDHKSQLVSRTQKVTLNQFNRNNAVALATEVSNKQLPVPQQQPTRRRQGSWNEEEKNLFLEGLQLYGKGNWKSISEHVKSRDCIQTQKFGTRHFERLAFPLKGRSPVFWNERYEELTIFKEENGHCKVPCASGQLGRWVDNQRNRRATTSKEKFNKLKDIGVYDW